MKARDPGLEQLGALRDAVLDANSADCVVILLLVGMVLVSRVASDVAHVTQLCIAQAYRGRGLVQALIEHALAAGRAAGFERASISFLIGNEAAERSYARAGFEFAEEKRDPAFEALTGAPGFRRFARAI